ncbi:substrate-binding domain-containing protein [Brevibacillus sp. M2.1A]|nr:substrate-binding domain-containing protein [Brevibacillus sp. M2.1A]
MSPGYEPTGHDEAQLCSQPWINYDLDLPIIRRFWREHFQKRSQTHPTHVVPDLHSVLMAIEHGAGISLLPTFMLDDHLSRNKVKIMYPSYTVHNDLYLPYQVKNRNLPHLKTLIETLKKTV